MRTQTTNSRLRIGLLAIAAGGSLVTALATREVGQREKLALLQQEVVVVDEITTEVNKALAATVEVVRSITSFFHSSNYVSRSEFATFCAPALESNCQIKALEWVPLVRHDERASYEREAQQDGHTDFRFTQRAEDGQLVPAEVRDSYMPVFYVQPIKGNSAALGFDLASSTDRLDAMIRAAASNQPQVSTPIRLVQSGGDAKGVLMFLPVHGDSSSEPTSLHLPSSLQGFALGVIHLDFLLDAILLQARRGSFHLGLELVDVGGDKPSDLFTKPLPDSPHLANARTHSIPLEFGGRPWELSVQLRDMKAAKILSHGQQATLLVGLLCTCLFIVSLWSARSLERNHQDLVRAHEVLRTRNEEITRFYHTASHELKTPMTSAREFTSLLIDRIPGDINETQAEYLGYVRESCDQLTRYINDMMDVSRIETGKLRVYQEPCSLEEISRTVVASTKLTAAEEGLDFTFRIPDHLPYAFVDRERFSQVLGNLLNNAIKFTRSGGRIFLGAAVHEDDPGQLMITVTDTGVGISEEHLDRIFERLHQVNEPGGEERGSSEGLGLGLAICREIVQIQGGRLWAESTPGEGTSFHFTVPLASEWQLLKTPNSAA